VPRLLSIAPNWNLGHLAHAYALAAIGRHEESVEACETALGLEADYAPAHHAIANQLLALGRTEAAWEHAERAIALKPETASYHATRASVARALGRGDEAMASLRQAVALDPQEPDHWVALVDLLDWRAHPEEAHTRLREILALDPENAKVFFRLGQLALEQQDYDQARFWLTETLRLDPAHKHAQVALDGIEMVGDRVDEATMIGEFGRAMRAAITEMNRKKPPPGQHAITLDKLGLLVAAHQRFLAELPPGTKLTWERLTFAGRKFEFFTEPGIKRLGDQLVLRGYELIDLTIPSAKLVYGNIAFTKIRNTTFEGCDLTNAMAVDVRGTGVHFVDCRIDRMDWSDSVLADCTFAGGSGDGLDFERVKLEGCTFRAISLAGVSFADATLVRCRFESVDLTTAKLAGARFDGCELVDCTPATLPE